MHICRSPNGAISFETAWAIHNCVLAMMITGHSTPPARLHTLKSSVHPTYAGRLFCQDPDCINRERGCLGNR